MRQACVILLLFFSCGCTSVPFKRTAYVSLVGADAQKIRLEFEKRLPQRFELVNSTVFAYRHMKFSVFGPMRADINKRSFTVAGLNQMGVKLFELSFDDAGIQSQYVFPELAKHGDFARASSEDIKRIYLDMAPPADAAVIPGKFKVTFRVPQKEGFLDYVFAGKDNLLIEKHLFVNKRKLWSVFYYEYTSKEGSLFPAGAILRHYDYNYYLLVRLKEILKIE